MSEAHAMIRRPFITSDLRPDLARPIGQTDLSLGIDATTEEIAAAADRVLEQSGYAQAHPRWDARQFLERTPKPSPDVQFTVLDEEAVLLNLNNGHYYTLNGVGTAIWELFAEGVTLGRILDAVCDRFDVDRERAHDDLIALVVRMEGEGLIQTERG